MKTIRNCILVVVLLIHFTASAQKGHGHGRGHRHGHKHPHKVVVVKRSPYRPARVKVFHPHWHPTFAYHRRWVFFPRYNLYWDNWRNHYVFWNGSIWISQPSPPPVVVNVNLEKEKHHELKEDEDDVDDIYKSNEEHKKEESPKDKPE
jgi:hypothetical protein